MPQVREASREAWQFQWAEHFVADLLFGLPLPARMFTLTRPFFLVFGARNAEAIPDVRHAWAMQSRSMY